MAATSIPHKRSHFWGSTLTLMSIFPMIATLPWLPLFLSLLQPVEYFWLIMILSWKSISSQVSVSSMMSGRWMEMNSLVFVSFQIDRQLWQMIQIALRQASQSSVASCPLLYNFRLCIFVWDVSSPLCTNWKRFLSVAFSISCSSRESALTISFRLVSKILFSMAFPKPILASQTELKVTRIGRFLFSAKLPNRIQSDDLAFNPICARILSIVSLSFSLWFKIYLLAL